jgi:hypothetical protein
VRRTQPPSPLPPEAACQRPIVGSPLEDGSIAYVLAQSESARFVEGFVVRENEGKLSGQSPRNSKFTGELARRTPPFLMAPVAKAWSVAVFVGLYVSFRL